MAGLLESLTDDTSDLIHASVTDTFHATGWEDETHDLADASRPVRPPELIRNLLTRRDAA